MKKTGLMLLMLLLQLSALSQTPIPINGTVTLPDSIKGQGWIQNYVQKAIKDAGGVTPGPGLDSCNKIGRDPKIIEIRDVTNKGLVTLYDAENVYKLNWVVSNLSGQPLRSGILEPNNNVPSISFNPELPAGIYNLTYTAASCFARYPTTKSFNVNAPPVENPACPEGPIIRKLLNSSATSVQVQHHSVGVKEISWWIVNDRGAQTQSGWFTSTDNSPVITFTNKLDAGTYTLWLSGHSCISQTPSQIQFTVSPDQGGGGGDPEPGTGSVLKVVDGYRPNMDIQITGEPGNLTISDNATILPKDYNSDKPENGYTFMYMVNGHRFRQNTPLKNYPYKGFNPIRVVKGQIRKDISENDGFNRWADRNEGGYFITDAGNVFPKNDSWPVYTAVLPGAKSDFINPIPVNYNPGTQYTQWADLDGGIKLPAGHIFNLRKGEWPYQQLQAKGVTHLSNYDLPWNVDDAAVGRLKGAGLTYNDVPTTAAIFRLGDSGVDDFSHADNINWRYWPTGELTEAQAISAAENSDAGHAVWVGETVEGNHRMPAEKRMWFYFYRTLDAKYQRDFGSRGITYYIAHNYFQLWGPPESIQNLNKAKPETDYYKALTLSKDELPRTDYSPGGTLSYTNLICEPVYLGAWDGQRGAVCQTIYRFALFKQMGFNGAVFLAPQHESRPNNYIHYPYSELDYYDGQKIPLDPNVVITYAFISQIFGKGYVLWGDAGKASGLRTFSDDIWTTGFAQDKQGKDVAFPYRSNNPKRGYLGGSDLSYFGTKLFADTYGKVEGGIDKWLDFRIDGGAWVTAKNSTARDAVAAYFGSRGFVHSRTKEGVTAWFYLNEWADNNTHKLEVRLPSGTIKTTTIIGNGVHTRVD